MEKEYLGLGVVFNALDKGFTKSVEGIQKALQGAGDAMAKVTAAASKGGGNIFGNLTEGFKMLSLAKIGHTLDDIQTGVAGTGHGVNEAAKQLDFMRAKMTAALDPKTASKFTSQMMGLTVSMGLTADQADTISHNLLNSGASVDKMGESLPMIGTMVGKLGMDAGQVATMFGQMHGMLHMSSREATGLTKSIFKLQKEYKLTNLMETLPEIVGNVYDNMLKLGKTSPEIANRMVQDVTKMAAAFQKMGMSQQKATQISTGFNDKVNEVRVAFKDLQAGLDPQSNIIQDIYDAFGSGGLNATDLISAIKTGKMTNEDIMKKMQGMVAGLGEQQQSNVMQRLRRTFGDDLTNVIGPMAKNMDAVNKEAADQAKKVGSSEDAWKGLTGQLNGTLKVSEQLKDSAKAYVDTLATLMSKGNIMQGLSAITSAAYDQAAQVGDLNSMWGAAYRSLLTYQAVGLAGLVPESMAKDFASVGLWAEMLGKLILPITSLLGIIMIFKGPLTWMRVLLFGTGEAAAAAAAGTEAAAVSTGLFGAALEAAGAALVFLLSPIGLVILAVVAIGAAIWAVIHYWDKLTDAVGYFSEDGADYMRRFGKFVGQVWDSIVSVALDVWEVIKDAVGWYIVAMINEIKFFGKVAIVVWDLIKLTAGALVAGLMMIWTPLKTFMSSLWGYIGKIVGQFVEDVTTSITSMVNWLQGMWKTVSTSVVTGFTMMFDEVKKMAGMFYDVLKPMLDPILNLFGMVKQRVGEMLTDIWDGFLTKFNVVKDLIMGGIKAITDAIPDFVKSDLSSMVSSFKNIFVHEKEPAKDAGGTVVAMAQGAGTMVSGSPVGGTTSIVPSQEGIPAAIPVKGQLGAPTMASVAGVDLTPTQSPKLDDKNFQAVVDMLASMKDAIVQALAKSNGKEVTVTIQGDMRKFMAVMKQASAHEAGAGGMNAALGG